MKNRNVGGRERVRGQTRRLKNSLGVGMEKENVESAAVRVSRNNC